MKFTRDNVSDRFKCDQIKLHPIHVRQFLLSSFGKNL